MNFMDRVAIGNARLYGMDEDLGMVGDQFQIAVSVLFITYCAFEVPSNLIIKRLQPAKYLAGLTIAWGFVATFTAFVQNFAGLVACRLLLGVFEAGLFPGVILYLTMFYSRPNIGLRTAYFFATSAISGAAGYVSLDSVQISQANGIFLQRPCQLWHWLYGWYGGVARMGELI